MIDRIVKGIDEEIARLQKVRELLAEINTNVPHRAGRPRKNVATMAETKPRRTLSAKARKAIADAQRKRWAAKKVASANAPETKKAVKKTTSRAST